MRFSGDMIKPRKLRASQTAAAFAWCAMIGACGEPSRATKTPERSSTVGTPAPAGLSTAGTGSIDSSTAAGLAIETYGENPSGLPLRIVGFTKVGDGSYRIVVRPYDVAMGNPKTNVFVSDGIKEILVERNGSARILQPAP